MVSQGEKLIKRHLEPPRTVPITTLSRRLTFWALVNQLTFLAVGRWIENSLLHQPATVATSTKDEPIKTPTESQ